jgi:hypothetical protein
MLPSSVPLLNAKAFDPTSVPPVGKTEELAVMLPLGFKVYMLAIALGAKRQPHKSNAAAKVPMVLNPVVETVFLRSQNVFVFIRL